MGMGGGQLAHVSRSSISTSPKKANSHYWKDEVSEFAEVKSPPTKRSGGGEERPGRGRRRLFIRTSIRRMFWRRAGQWRFRRRRRYRIPNHSRKKGLVGEYEDQRRKSNGRTDQKYPTLPPKDPASAGHLHSAPVDSQSKETNSDGDEE